MTGPLFHSRPQIIIIRINTWRLCDFKDRSPRWLDSVEFPEQRILHTFSRPLLYYWDGCGSRGGGRRFIRNWGWMTARDIISCYYYNGRVQALGVRGGRVVSGIFISSGFLWLVVKCDAAIAPCITRLFWLFFCFFLFCHRGRIDNVGHSVRRRPSDDDDDER